MSHMRMHAYHQVLLQTGVLLAQPPQLGQQGSLACCKLGSGKSGCGGSSMHESRGRHLEDIWGKCYVVEM